MRALLDTNIIVDVLQSREPWYIFGQKIFLAAANRRFEGCITAKEATDIHYFARKLFKGEKNIDCKARRVISGLFSLFELLDTRSSDCQKAVLSACPDYEDAVMIETGIRARVDCIVTRNTGDYASSPIPVYSPSDFLTLLDTFSLSF
jgi:predicted nucleic acid-binding protein